MTTSTFDARDALDMYYPDRASARPARLWSIEKLVLVLAEAGFVTLFSGSGSNPTTLTGYASSKLWLQVSSGVTEAPGTIRSYDGSGDATLLGSWPILDLAGLRRHLSVYSRAEVDAAIASGLPSSFGTDDLVNDTAISGSTASAALVTLKGLIDTANTNISSNTSALATKVNTSTLGALSGVATLDSGGKLTASQIPSSITSPFQFQGTWNATTNSPALASGVGTAGHLYRVSVAGSTTLDGQSGWQVGDEVYFGGGVWNRLGTQSPTVISLIGKTVGYSGGNTRHFVTSNNELFAVGDSTNSQNGYSAGNTILPTLVPFNVAPSTITKVVSGAKSTYILDSTGKVWAFGGNAKGQLGLNDTTARQLAVRIEYFVSNSIVIADIFPCTDAGGARDYVFFLSTTGVMYACGDNTNGQLGLGDTTQRNQPAQVTAVSSIATVIVAGNSTPHTLAITTSGALWTCGYNGSGQLGHGDTTERTTFTVVSGFTNAASGAACAGSSAPSGASFIVKTDGTLWSCGLNSTGSLGLGDTTSRSSFNQVTTVTGITKVAVSADVATGATVAALKSNGNVYVWGYNASGACGTGNTTNQTSPQLPSGAFQTKATDILVGGAASTAVYIRTSDSQIWAAGYSGNGNLGAGSLSATVTSFDQAYGVAGTVSDFAVVGTALTYGLSVLYSDGRVGVCGAGAAGQLGVGVAANSSVLRTFGAARMGQ